MRNLAKLIRPVGLALLVGAVSACAINEDFYGRREYYPYDYPWYYTRYGTYTIVRRPVVVVDGWTTRAFRYRPYRGYVVRRHNSPVITYSATNKRANIEVALTPMGDSTQVEVRASRGSERWDQDQARTLMGHILEEYK